MEQKQMRLSEIPLNEWRQIDRLEGPQEDCNRLLDMGFTPGEDIAIIQAVPFGDPLIVHLRGARIAVRRREASWIWVR
jgi:ferrous iron transport protein A